MVTEVCYLLAREAGARAEAAFLAPSACGRLTVVDREAAYWRRAVDLVTTYADLPLAALGASLTAMAELGAGEPSQGDLETHDLRLIVSGSRPGANPAAEGC